MQTPVSQTDLPVSIQKVLARARMDLSPERIILFGSRARQQHTETSDFDISISGVSDSAAWTNFSNYVHYDAPTLYNIDLVRYESAPPDLKARIDSEGRPIDEQTETR